MAASTNNKKTSSKKTSSSSSAATSNTSFDERIEPQVSSQLVMLQRNVKRSSTGSIISYREYKLMTNLLERIARRKGIAPTKMLIDTRKHIIMRVQPAMLPRPDRKKDIAEAKTAAKNLLAASATIVVPETSGTSADQIITPKTQ